jgi:hypothetical protein
MPQKWKWGRFEPHRLQALCIPEHVKLHTRFARCVRGAMSTAHVDHVFIMTHPSLYIPVNTMLGIVRGVWCGV